MSERNVRVTLLGNAFGSRAQLPALRWAGGNEVVALAGHDAEKARETARAWGIPCATDDWRTLLEVETDLVLVSTPVDLHHPMVAAFLETGAAVLCEKPFALDVAQAHELTERAAGRAAWIDHELRWIPALRCARALCHEGFLGEPWEVSLEAFVHPGRFLRRPWSWWFQAERGGGVLGALGSHLIDLARWIAGEIVGVRGELATFVPRRADTQGVEHPVTADEYAALDLRFAGGFRGTIATSVALPRERVFALQLSGSAGTLRVNDGDELLGAAIGEPLAPLAVDQVLPSAAELGMPDEGLFARSLPLFLRDVVRTVAAGKTELAEAATFADGLAVQRVLDGARCSAQSDGGWVGCTP